MFPEERSNILYGVAVLFNGRRCEFLSNCPQIPASRSPLQIIDAEKRALANSLRNSWQIQVIKRLEFNSFPSKILCANIIRGCDQ